MIKGDAKILALEAGRTLMVHRAEMIEMADKAGIAVVGVI
jgi:DUF1009 family protein